MAAINPDPATSAAAVRPTGALYDARRRVYYAKPVLRGWLHAVCQRPWLLFAQLLVANA